jgi:hypothetical protein
MAKAIDLVREETGLDLSNALLQVETLAPAFAGRINVVLGDLDRAIAVTKKIFSAYKSLTSTTTPLAVYQLAYGAVKDAYSWLQGQAAKAQNDSLKRRAKTRDEFLQQYYGLPVAGDPAKLRACWSMVFAASKSPSPKDLDLVNQAGGWTPLEHLQQYRPRQLVFHVDRVALPQALNPTWSVPPYDETGVTPDLWGNGYTWNNPTLLGGYSQSGAFFTKPPPVPGIPEKYRKKYWGNAPNGGSIQPPNPTPDGDFGTNWGALDASIFLKGYAPPPGYHWLFSLGTYPWTGWEGPAGQIPIAPVADLSGMGALLAGAIHSITPIHAQITWNEVAQCYKHFVQVSGFRKLAPLPAGQVDLGIYLNTKPPASEPEKYLLPTGVNTIKGIPLPGTAYPVEMIAEIELAFRRWFALRRSIIYQFVLTPKSFQDACKTSPDTTLRALANGAAPPAYKPWVVYDPLEEGWWDSGGKPAPKHPYLGGGKIKSPGGSGGGGGAAVVVAGAAAAYFFLKP